MAYVSSCDCLLTTEHYCLHDVLLDRYLLSGSDRCDLVLMITNIQSNKKLIRGLLSMFAKPALWN